MKVLFAKDQVKGLKRRILKAYPKEHMELLWGKFVRPDEFHIYMCDQIKHKGTRRTVKYNEEEYQISSDHAINAGLVLLGSIHSHPDCYDAAPSECDYDDALAVGDVISGIALVSKNKLTGRRRVKIRFWGPLQQVSPCYF